MKKLYVLFLISLFLMGLIACSEPQTYQEAIAENIGETEVVIGNNDFTIAPDVLHISCPADTSDWQTASSVKIESFTMTIGYLEYEDEHTQVNIYDNTVRGLEREEPLVNTFEAENKYKVYRLVKYGPETGGMEIRMGFCNGQYVYQVKEY